MKLLKSMCLSLNVASIALSLFTIGYILINRHQENET